MVPLPSLHFTVGSFIIQQISIECPPCARYYLGAKDTAILKIVALIYVIYIFVEGQKSHGGSKFSM